VYENMKEKSTITDLVKNMISYYGDSVAQVPIKDGHIYYWTLLPVIEDNYELLGRGHENKDTYYIRKNHNIYKHK